MGTSLPVRYAGCNNEKTLIMLIENKLELQYLEALIVDPLSEVSKSKKYRLNKNHNKALNSINEKLTKQFFRG